MRYWISLLLFVTTAVLAADIREIEVPSDSEAKYALLGKRVDALSNVILLTVRVGSDGTRYEMRQFNCQEQKFKYLGKGRTLEDLERYPAEQKLTLIFPSTPTYDLFLVACK
jgi:hypothetical protein